MLQVLLMQLICKSDLDLMQVGCNIPGLQTHYSHYEQQQTQYQFLNVSGIFQPRHCTRGSS